MKQSEETQTPEKAMANLETLFDLRHYGCFANGGVTTKPFQRLIDMERAIALVRTLLELVRRELAVVEGE